MLLDVELTMKDDECQRNVRKRFAGVCHEQCDQKKLPNVYKRCPKMI